jgi:hypothetical protein
MGTQVLIKARVQQKQGTKEKVQSQAKQKTQQGQTQSQSISQTTTSGNNIKAFIVMPFSKEYDSVFSAIKRACVDSGVEAIRADEIMKPGPIINQIFDSISKADCVIAEIGSKNPNVYYEIAIAHCVEKPSILVAREDRLEAIPFDLRHNRIIPYKNEDLESFVNSLVKSLKYIKEIIISGRPPLSLEDHLSELDPTNKQGSIVLQSLINQIGAEFRFTNPKLEESSMLQDGSYSVRIKDDFGEKAVFTLDVNGNIKRKKRL